MKKKIRRIILGIGHPWYSCRWGSWKFTDVRLYKTKLPDGGLFQDYDIKNIVHFNLGKTGNWNKIRLVAEILE